MVYASTVEILSTPGWGTFCNPEFHKISIISNPGWERGSLRLPIHISSCIAMHSKPQGETSETVVTEFFSFPLYFWQNLSVQKKILKNRLKLCFLAKKMHCMLSFQQKSSVNFLEKSILRTISVTGVSKSKTEMLSNISCKSAKSWIRYQVSGAWPPTPLWTYFPSAKPNTIFKYRTNKLYKNALISTLPCFERTKQPPLSIQMMHSHAFKVKTWKVDRRCQSEFFISGYYSTLALPGFREACWQPLIFSQCNLQSAKPTPERKTSKHNIESNFLRQKQKQIMSCYFLGFASLLLESFLHQGCSLHIALFHFSAIWNIGWSTQKTKSKHRKGRFEGTSINTFLSRACSFSMARQSCLL